MEETKYTPGQIIFKEDSADDFSLYYIVDGEIEIFSQKNKNEKTLSTGPETNQVKKMSTQRSIPTLLKDSEHRDYLQ